MAHSRIIFVLSYGNIAEQQPVGRWVELKQEPVSPSRINLQLALRSSLRAVWIKNPVYVAQVIPGRYSYLNHNYIANYIPAIY